MSGAIALPYTTISDDHCLLGNWLRSTGPDETVEINNEIAGWDYDANVELTRSISLKPLSMVDQIGIANSKPRLELVVTAESGPTSYRWIAYRTDIPIDDDWEQSIPIRLNSHHLAQRVRLHTEIILSNRIRSSHPFTARDLGSRLFHESSDIQIEGSLGRFPMEMLNFETGIRALRAGDALWFLDWDPARPESQFLGTVILYINSAHEDFAAFVQNADPTILQLIRCDVIRTMCQAMLHNEDFYEDYLTYSNDSVGGQVREWLQLAFGDESMDVLRTRLESMPGQFEAQIQHAFH